MGIVPSISAADGYSGWKAANGHRLDENVEARLIPLFAASAIVKAINAFEL